MSETMEFLGELTTVTCWCGIHFAIPSQLDRYRNRKHNEGNDHTIYCPNGHGMVPMGESKVAQLERRLEREQEERARVSAERDQAQASARAQKAATTRAKKRAGAAVCPCCHRSFKQLRQHMASKHPDYDPAEAG